MANGSSFFFRLNLAMLPSFAIFWKCSLPQIAPFHLSTYCTFTKCRSNFSTVHHVGATKTGFKIDWMNSMQLFETDAGMLVLPQLPVHWSSVNFIHKLYIFRCTSKLYSCEFWHCIGSHSQMCLCCDDGKCSYCFRVGVCTFTTVTVCSWMSPNPVWPVSLK